MTTARNTVWAIIPARGGSKSVPQKNLAPLAGRPLISYVIRAAQASPVGRIVCTTDDDAIAHYCRTLDVHTHPRPAALAQDDSPVRAALVELLRTQEQCGDTLPELFVLLQPTSPFVLPAHIEACVALLRDHPDANSAQTITDLPHNAHAYNQRLLRDDGHLAFAFEAERRTCYNKQRKPAYYLFGSLFVIRTRAFLESDAIAPHPSLPYRIERPYALDVDQPDDFALAEWYMQTGRVTLP